MFASVLCLLLYFALVIPLKNHPPYFISVPPHPHCSRCMTGSLGIVKGWDVLSWISCYVIEYLDGNMEQGQPQLNRECSTWRCEKKGTLGGGTWPCWWLTSVHSWHVIITCWIEPNVSRKRSVYLGCLMKSRKRGPRAHGDWQCAPQRPCFVSTATRWRLASALVCLLWTLSGPCLPPAEYTF